MSTRKSSRTRRRSRRASSSFSMPVSSASLSTNEDGKKKGLTLFLAMSPFGQLGFDKWYVGKYRLLGIVMVLFFFFGIFISNYFLWFNNFLIFAFCSVLIYSIFTDTSPFIYGSDIEWRRTNGWDMFIAVIALIGILYQAFYFVYGMLFAVDKQLEEEEKKEEEKKQQMTEEEKKHKEEEDEFFRNEWDGIVNS